MSITVSRLKILYKQRDDFFYPGWAYTIPTYVLRLPYSILEAILWTCLTYYVIGFAPEVGRYDYDYDYYSITHTFTLSLFYSFTPSLLHLWVANFHLHLQGVVCIYVGL